MSAINFSIIVRSPFNNEIRTALVAVLIKYSRHSESLVNDNLVKFIALLIRKYLSCAKEKNFILLSDLVELKSEKNNHMLYSLNDLMGVSLNKQFIKSPINTSNLSIDSYKIVRYKQLACNLMHVGRDKKIAIGLMNKKNGAIISPAFHVFEVRDYQTVMPEYLISWFSQEAFDEELSFMASEGIREGMKWITFASSKIFIPSITEQDYIAKVYNHIQNNNKKIEFLSNLLEAYISIISRR